MATLYRAFTVEASRQADSACTVWRDARCRAESQAGMLLRNQSRRNPDTKRYALELDRLGRWERHSPEWRFSARQSGDWPSRSSANTLKRREKRCASGV